MLPRMVFRLRSSVAEHALKEKIRRQVALLRRVQPPVRNAGRWKKVRVQPKNRGPGLSPRALSIFLLMLSAGPAQGLAASAPLAEKARAVLQQHCLSCHGEARISGLDLRQRESLLKGGDSGPAIVPGHPEESLLYLAVLQTGELKMPVGGTLSPEEVEVLRGWIQAGAPWEEDPHGPDGLSTWWSFQGLGDPKVPGVRNPGWVRTPVDAFVLHKLEEKGLEPAPRAGKLTLLRRVKFDLHGLPPTEQEIEQFLGDAAPGAFARLVDRCWPRLATGNAGAAIGWTSPATPIPAAWTKTSPCLCLALSGLRSSTASIGTFPTIVS